MKLTESRRGLIAFVAFALSAAVATANEVKLADHLPENAISGLREVLEAAMTEAESIQLRDIVEQDFEGRQIVAESGKNLSIQARTTYRKEQDLERDESSTGDRLLYSLTLSKSLYHWGALEANREKGDLNLEIAELTTFETYRNLALNIRSKYLAILVANKEAELSRKNYERSLDRLKLEKDRLETGAASVIQVYNLEVAANGAELDLLKKENALDDQIDVLARLVGMSPERIASGLDSGIPEHAILSREEIGALQQYFDEGVNRSPSIQSQAKSIEHSERDVHISSQRRKPKIDITAGITQFEIDEISRTRAEEIVYGGVSVSWNIFDGRATKGYKISAMARVEQLRRQFESAKSTYQFNLERAQRFLDLNARILEREEKALIQASNYLRDTKRDFDSGRASPDDLEKVEISFASQDVRTQRARSEYYNALSNMASLLGFDGFAQKFIDIRSQ